jgi:hypothetical protein
MKKPSKIKAVVFTRRTTPPTSIVQCLKAASFIGPTFRDPQANVDSINELLSKEKPRLVLIDGEYSLDDKTKWQTLSKKNAVELRLYLLSQSATPDNLPESLNVMRIVHALKGGQVDIAIFIDAPSEALKMELKALGADVVWPTLHTLSKLEESFYSILGGTKAVAVGLAGMVKAFHANLTSPTKRH